MCMLQALSSSSTDLLFAFFAARKPTTMCSLPDSSDHCFRNVISVMGVQNFVRMAGNMRGKFLFCLFPDESTESAACSS